MSLPQGVGLATPEVAELWDDYVASRPEGSICHLFGWKEVVERTYGHECFYLYLGEADSLSGVLPLVLIRPPLLGASLVSMPFLDRGGAVAATDEARHLLHKAATHLAKTKRAKRVELRGGTSGSLDAAVGESQRYRLILPLTETEESLWKAIGSKVRNQVRKAEKSQLSTRRVGPEGLSDFYEIFADSMRNLGSPVHSRRLFEELFRVLGGRVSLYLTYLDDSVPVAGAVALTFRDQTVVPWAASLRSERKRCPNHSLYWQILSEAVERGEKSFDFGRSWADSGTFHFKKQWGAEPHELQWARLDSQGHPISGSNLKPQEHQRLTDIWTRLPLGASKWLGCRIRGYLAN